MWIIIAVIALAVMTACFAGKTAHKHRKHKKVVIAEGTKYGWSPERQAREARHLARRHK